MLCFEYVIYSYIITIIEFNLTIPWICGKMLVVSGKIPLFLFPIPGGIIIRVNRSDVSYLVVLEIGGHREKWEMGKERFLDPEKYI